jgi:vacuolar-type H+-ATPase subunit B/Vma2
MNAVLSYGILLIISENALFRAQKIPVFDSSSLFFSDLSF